MNVLNHFSDVKSAKLSDVETKIVCLCWEHFIFIFIFMILFYFILLLKLQLEHCAPQRPVTLADMGAGDRDEAGNGTMLAHLHSIKDDLAHSTVF